MPCTDTRTTAPRRRAWLAWCAALAAPAACAQGGGGAAAAAKWEAFQRRAAERLVAANPQHTYTGEVPAELFGIPILDIELARDGSVSRIQVKRRPANAEAADTVRIAIEAVRRAAPYGDMAGLPKPWIWTEVFLFDEKRRFKPRTLDN